jgi:hypothetical protein
MPDPLSRSYRALIPILVAGLEAAAGPSCAGGLGRPPAGDEVARTAEEARAIAGIRTRVDGLVVWSSSRLGNHDLFVMKTDGSAVRRLTATDHVDWYPRFDVEGRRILFTRSKHGWVSEQDANRPEKWDLYVMPTSGGPPKLVAANATWGIWLGPEKILFSRRTRVLAKDLASGSETLLADSEKVPGLGGADLQNPHLSPDGKVLALTLRGSRRETGLLRLDDQRWTKTGEGCQINWFPQGDRILWVNQSGNGGSEVFAAPVKDGGLARELREEELRFVDLPGRRSHEYFPELDRSGRFLVWAATQRGHDHDIADYEIYIWEVGSPPSAAARLTFHSANDRWPDIYIPRTSK